MRLIIKTHTKDLYFVSLPNYMDIDSNVNFILKEAIEQLPEESTYKSHYINSDDLCDEERKQLDYYGEIKYPLISLNVSIYETE